MLRVRGQIYNKDSFTAHAAPLQLQVLGADKTVLARDKIIPDNKFIAAGQTTDFFVQKEVEKAVNAEVRVDLLAESLLLDMFCGITQRGFLLILSALLSCGDDAEDVFCPRQ